MFCTIHLDLIKKANNEHGDPNKSLAEKDVRATTDATSSKFSEAWLSCISSYRTLSAVIFDYYVQFTVIT